jgi:hypothetical protein
MTNAALARQYPASADEPDAERIAASPNNFAPARGSPGHESDIQQASNFHGGVDGYLCAALRDIRDLAFVIGRAVTQRDPRRLMAPPAHLLSLYFELWPDLIHADTLTVKRLNLVHCDPSLCTCGAASMLKARALTQRSMKARPKSYRRMRQTRRAGPARANLIGGQFDSTGAMRSAIRSSPWQTRQIQLVPRNNSVALFMSPNWR